jgi:hypothetical protein
LPPAKSVVFADYGVVGRLRRVGRKKLRRSPGSLPPAKSVVFADYGVVGACGALAARSCGGARVFCRLLISTVR